MVSTFILNPEDFVQYTPIDLITGQLDTLTNAERKVGQFVLANVQAVATYTVAETAHAAGVSEATVVRFCRSVGYKGYLDFRFELVKMLGDPVRNLHGDIQPNDDIAKIAERTIYSGIASLRDTLALIDADAVERVVAAVQAAGYVMIVGVGTSAPFALDLYHKLIRLGLNCEALTDPYTQLIKIALLSPGDVVIALTHSGASAEPVDALRYARERGATTVAITGNVPSPITRHSDIILQYGARETRLEPVIARIAQLAICDVFFMALAMQDVVRTDANEKKIWELVITHVVAD